MAKIRRNGPCPCGSGSKAKRCCYGPEDTVGTLPPEILADVLPDLKGSSEEVLRSLFNENLYLPELDTTLQVRLGILTPAMDRAIDALQDGDDEGFDDILGTVVPEVDSVDRRVELARAVLTLRDRGSISPQQAAVAILDLEQKESVLFLSSVAESLAVLAGDRSTPAGLLVATS